MTNMKRRTFLKGGVASSILTIAAGSGLLRPTEVLAASWPKAAFEATKMDTAINHLFGSTATKKSSSIKITAPLQAENGAVVPVTVSSSLSNVEGIGIFVEKNPSPLAASLKSSGASGYLSARIKMGKTSPVIAVVKSNGKLFSAKTTIKVTVGGCGG